MREIYEFRIPEKYADRLFDRDEGIRLGDTVRKILLSGDDPRLPQVGKLDKAICAQAKEPPRYFFAGWNVRYRYAKEELNAALALQLSITRTFEPAGEECGTVYDESTACPDCGAGATQTSALRLDLRKAPKNKDIAQTIASEIIVSQRLAELLTDNDLKGFELRQVRHKARYADDPFDLHEVASGREILQKAEAAGAPHPTGRFWVWLNRAENRVLSERAQKEYVELKRQARQLKGKPAPIWYQLVATTPVEIVSPTRVGINPFDDDEKGECRCPRGDTIGLNLLSELSVSRKDFKECAADIARTRQYIGTRRGLLRPNPLLVISPKLWRILVENEVKGFSIEVAHLR